MNSFIKQFDQVSAKSKRVDISHSSEKVSRFRSNSFYKLRFHSTREVNWVFDGDGLATRYKEKDEK